MSPPCVVLGLHHNGLGVARALGRQGVEVLAVDSAVESADAQTRYARVVACPGFRDPRLVDTLCALGRELGRPAVLIPTTDRSVELVSEHRERLEPYFLHSLPARDVVQCLLNKAAIADFASREGFQIPRTFAIANEAELESASAAIGFPCILKPQVKTEALMRVRTQKAYRVQSLTDLRRIYQGIAPAEPHFVLQEWIPGPDTRLIFCLYYFDDDGKPIASFTGRKIRQFIPYCGTACSAEPWQDEYVREAGVRFFQATAYRGFGAIEFKRSPTGAYFLMEPTVGRTEHLFAMAAANGVNLPYIGYCDMAGLPPPPIRQTSRPVKYLHWKRDFNAARVYLRAGDLSILDWLSSLRGAKQNPIFAWDDIGPLRRYITDRLLAPRRALGRFLESRPSPFGDLTHEIPLRIRRWAPNASGSVDAHLEAAFGWLAAAQDACPNGGVARGYTLSAAGETRAGWQHAYPETTGYIIPTLLDCAAHYGRADLRDRAIRLADWLLAVQHVDGGIPGGVVGKQRPVVVFNTGMVLHGWCRAYAATRNPSYLAGLCRAADFLVLAQDPDGAWRRFSNMDGNPRFHAYDVLVCWPLLMAHELTGDFRYRQTAIRNLDFTLTLQRPNGWLQSNDLRPERNHRPLTHTIGYAAAGLLESGLLLNDQWYVAAADLIASNVARQLRSNGWLAGEFFADWKPAASWSCLTGNAQMAIVWLKLWELSGNESHRAAARRANAYLRQRQDLTSSNPGIRGGLPGSRPIHARYGRYQYLNWATKFLADSLLGELRSEATHAAGVPVTAASSPHPDVTTLREHRT